MRYLIAAVMLAACASPTEPKPSEPDVMYTNICVDSIWVHPTYNCYAHVDTVRVTIIIPSPEG